MLYRYRCVCGVIYDRQECPQPVRCSRCGKVMKGMGKVNDPQRGSKKTRWLWANGFFQA